MRLKFQRPPAREDQDTQITEYEAKAVEILNFPRKKAKKKKAQIPPFECYDFFGIAKKLVWRLGAPVNKSNP